MSQIKHTKEHEWIDVDDDIGTVGITDYAQEQLGDVVYVELPEVGAIIEQGAVAAVVESVKAASEVYAPVSGEVVEVNSGLEDNPALVNESAMNDGWFIKVRVIEATQLDGLLDSVAYQKLVDDED